MRLALTFPTFDSAFRLSFVGIICLRVLTYFTTVKVIKAGLGRETNVIAIPFFTSSTFDPIFFTVSLLAFGAPLLLISSLKFGSSPTQIRNIVYSFAISLALADCVYDLAMFVSGSSYAAITTSWLAIAMLMLIVGVWSMEMFKRDAVEG